MKFINSAIQEAIKDGREVKIIEAPMGDMGIDIEGLDYIIIDAWEAFETELDEGNQGNTIPRSELPKTTQSKGRNED
jgi:hypothetical protein